MAARSRSASCGTSVAREDGDDFDFQQTMTELYERLELLNAEARDRQALLLAGMPEAAIEALARKQQLSAVLVVKAKDRTFQFGLMGGKFWEGDLPFPVEREAGPVGY